MNVYLRCAVGCFALICVIFFYALAFGMCVAARRADDQAILNHTPADAIDENRLINEWMMNPATRRRA